MTPLDFSPCDRPRVIESLRGVEVVDIAAGGAHSACITASGELFTWGKGRYGRLGHGDSEDQLKPKLVSDHSTQLLRILQYTCCALRVCHSTKEAKTEKLLTRSIWTGIKQFTQPHAYKVSQTVTVR